MEIKCPKCNSNDVTLEDDSFTHEFGTEIIKYYLCNNCGFFDKDNKYAQADWETSSKTKEAQNETTLTKKIDSRVKSTAQVNDEN